MDSYSVTLTYSELSSVVTSLRTAHDDYCGKPVESDDCSDIELAKLLESILGNG